MIKKRLSRASVIDAICKECNIEREKGYPFESRTVLKPSVEIKHNENERGVLGLVPCVKGVIGSADRRAQIVHSAASR